MVAFHYIYSHHKISIAETSLNIGIFLLTVRVWLRTNNNLLTMFVNAHTCRFCSFWLTVQCWATRSYICSRTVQTTGTKFRSIHGGARFLKFIQFWIQFILLNILLRFTLFIRSNEAFISHINGMIIKMYDNWLLLNCVRLNFILFYFIFSTDFYLPILFMCTKTCSNYRENGYTHMYIFFYRFDYGISFG